MRNELQALADRLDALPPRGTAREQAALRAAQSVASFLLANAELIAHNADDLAMNRQVEQVAETAAQLSEGDEARRIIQRMVRIVEELRTAACEGMIVEAEVIDAEVLDAELLDEPVEAEVVDAEVVDPVESSAEPGGGSAYFWTRDNVTQYGPVSSKQLRDLAKAGTLLPTDLVWKGGAAKWIEASRVKGLFKSTAAPRSRSSRTLVGVVIGGREKPTADETTRAMQRDPEILKFMGDELDLIPLGGVLVQTLKTEQERNLYVAMLVKHELGKRDPFTSTTHCVIDDFLVIKLWK